MRYVLAVLLLLALGCNQSSNYKLTALGEPSDFSILVNQLNSDLAKIGEPPIPGNISYYAWNEQGYGRFNLDGLCSKDQNGNVAISLNVDINDLTVSDYIMFVHEIGHCVYSKGHDDSSINIMNSAKSADMRAMFLDEPTRLHLIKEITSH